MIDPLIACDPLGTLESAIAYLILEHIKVCDDHLNCGPAHTQAISILRDAMIEVHVEVYEENY